jgi:hypothetical protein
MMSAAVVSLLAALANLLGERMEIIRKEAAGSA